MLTAAKLMLIYSSELNTEPQVSVSNVKLRAIILIPNDLTDRDTV